MCGRYRLSRRKQLVEEHFDCGSDEPDWSPRYNVAPTQPVPVIRQNTTEPVRELSLMRWGLIPSWAKDPSIATSTINARSETVATKPEFRDALKFRRCLIPADGFYEWVRTGKSKQPFQHDQRTVGNGGHEARAPRTASKSTEGNCSHSQDYGIAGRTQVATG